MARGLLCSKQSQLLQMWVMQMYERTVLAAFSVDFANDRHKGPWRNKLQPIKKYLEWWNGTSCEHLRTNFKSRFTFCVFTKFSGLKKSVILTYKQNVWKAENHRNLLVWLVCLQMFVISLYGFFSEWCRTAPCTHLNLHRPAENWWNDQIGGADLESGHWRGWSSSLVNLRWWHL